MLIQTTHFELEIHLGMLFVRIGRRCLFLGRLGGEWRVDYS